MATTQGRTSDPRRHEVVASERCQTGTVNGSAGVTGVLTAREAEVLALLRDRLTNNEIADQLVVSVRTVESHVSALLRKLAVDDRRALALLAPAARSALPTPLTPFVGRARELDALVAAVSQDRLVTATGPGGVGKTRLALAAAHRLAAGHRDGATFVDLVTVVDPAMVVAAVADAVGVPERAGANRQDVLLAALAERDCLLVLDNCEHVVDGVRPCVERLLTACPTVRALATSRIRLMLPFESVFPVPGLSIGDAPAKDGEGEAPDGDAVTLFVARMVAGGADKPATAADRERVRAICRALDGMALAIELAAARAPAIGLDGLSSALDAPLPLLTVGHRSDHRHRSLRATLDWSHALLDDEERASLRASAVFAGRFDPDALASVMDRPQARTVAILGRLVDWNLLSIDRGRITRYRMLETIRQYATSLADETDEGERLRQAHLRWAQGHLERLLDSAGSAGRAGADGAESWCREVDAVLDDARAALHWAGEKSAHHPMATTLAEVIAAVSFQRGRPGEAQARYEQAARWAAAAADRHQHLRWAAGAAAARNVGVDAVDLLEQAALGAPDPELAAEDLATAAMYQYRCPGIMGRAVPVERTESLLDRARQASRGGLKAEATIAMASGWTVGSRARSRSHTEVALRLARAAGDPILQSQVLDQLAGVELADRDFEAALDALRTRLAVLAELPVDARTGFEFYDASQMACHLFLTVGNLAAAMRRADAVAALPFFREERHIGLGRRVDVDTLAGNFHTVVESGERMERDWSRAGRPVASNLAISAHCVATAHGILGNPAAQRHWKEITKALLGAQPLDRSHRVGWRPALDALVSLHTGDPAAALAQLAVAPDDEIGWGNPNRAVWLPWYAAFWAEASVLSGHPDATDRLARVAHLVRANPIAVAIVERSRLLLHGDTTRLPQLSRRLAEAGCPYQRDRTDQLAARAR